MQTITPMPDKLLENIVSEFDQNDDTVAIGLVGSHVRGDANEYSDIDILRFTSASPQNDLDKYTLSHREGHLVSITVATIEAKRDELHRPQSAIRAVPGLRHMHILLDKDGSLGELKREAETFRWEPLQEAANEFASYTLMGYAEEAHKILAGLKANDESSIAYAMVGMFLGMTEAVAVQKGVLIESDNTYMRQVQDAMGKSSEWTRLQRILAGIAKAETHTAPVRARGLCALNLYEETVNQLHCIIQPRHREVIDKTLQAIRLLDSR